MTRDLPVPPAFGTEPEAPQVDPPFDSPDAEIDPSKLDPDALKVVRRLHQHGHQAYFVGGCVRDLLLNHKPKDFDIATSAHPGEVRAIFRNCRLIGRRFRLAHVYFKGGKVVEVSTFRANPSEVEELQAQLDEAGAGEGEAAEAEGQGEREAVDESAASTVEEDLLITHDNVFGTAEQDARRRDFTINGLFYDVEQGQVLDYVRGRRDLDARFIRTIGDPEVRMREDPVRILRAVRFACRLGFDFEPRTYAATEGAVEDLPRCAPPRLLEETFRLIRGGVASPAIRLLAALDALKILLPPVDQFVQANQASSQEAFYAFTDALDRRTGSGQVLEDAILLAVLLYPLSRAAPGPDDARGTPTVAEAIEDLLSQFVNTARLPRRIAERCKALLLAQRTLSGERRRRGSLASFRRHPLFQEALIVFECVSEATGQFAEELRTWKEGGAPGAKEGAAPEARKRRRRRKRPGDPEDKAVLEGASADPPSASAPTE